MWAAIKKAINSNLAKPLNVLLGEFKASARSCISLSWSAVIMICVIAMSPCTCPPSGTSIGLFIDEIGQFRPFHRALTGLGMFVRCFMLLYI